MCSFDGSRLIRKPNADVPSFVEDADHDPVAEGAAAEAEEEQEEEEEEDVIEVDTGEDDEDEEDEPDAAPSRKRNPGDVHFSVLLDKGVIRPGHFMMVPHKTMRGVYASMIVRLPPVTSKQQQLTALSVYHSRTPRVRVACDL